MKPPFLLLTSLGMLTLLAASAQAQSRLLQALDMNKDGKISRDEIPEGARRRMFDNLVEKYKLDPKKTYTVEELEKVTEIRTSPISGSSVLTVPSGGSRSSSPSRFGVPREPSRNGSPAAPARAATDNRPYRALVELPEQYKSYDKNGDGQVGLYEWPRDRIAEFLKLDKNDDGFLTPSELKTPAPLEGSKEKPPEPPRDSKEPSSQPSSEKEKPPTA